MNKVFMFMDIMRGSVTEFGEALLYCYLFLKRIDSGKSFTEIIENEIDNSIKYNIQKVIDFQNLNDLFIKIESTFTRDDLYQIFMEKEGFIDNNRSSVVATPTHVNQLIVSLLPKQDFFVYADFCAGLGYTMMHLVDNGIKNITAIEISTVAYTVCKLRAQELMNINSELKIEVINDDIFEYSMKNPDKKFDYVISDFPWGVKGEYNRDLWLYSRFEMLRHSRVFDWHFMSVALKHANTAFVLAPPSIEYRNNDDLIRDYFIRNGLISKIIQLPTKTMKNTSIAPLLIELSEKNLFIEFIDASSTFHEVNRLNVLLQEDIETINNKENSRRYIRSLKEVLDAGRLIPSFYSISKIEKGVMLNDVSIIIRGNNFRRAELDKLVSEYQTGNLLIRTSHLIGGSIENPNHLKEKPVELEVLEDKDILITRVGSNLQTAIYLKDENESAIVDQSILVVRTDKDKMDPYYLLAFLQSDIGKERLKNLYTGNTISQLSVQNLRTYNVPSLPLKEQKILGIQYKHQQEKILQAKLQFEILLEENNEQINDWFKEVR